MLPPEPKRLAPPKAADTKPDHMHPVPVEPYAQPQAVPAPAALSAAPSMGTLLHALRRCWRVAVPLAVMGALAAAGAAWVMVPPQYSSAVVFGISIPPEDGNQANKQKMYLNIVKRFDVLEDAIKKGKPEDFGGDYTPQSLGRKLQASFLEGPELLTASLAGENPEAVQAVLNGLGRAFPDKVNSMEQASIKAQIAQLEESIGRAPPGKRNPDKPPTLAEQLDDKRTELTLAEAADGIPNGATLSLKQQTATAKHAAAEANLSKRVLEKAATDARLEAKKEALETLTPPAVSLSEAEDKLKTDPEYAALLATIRALQTRIDDGRETLIQREFQRVHADDLAKMKKLRESQKSLQSAMREKLRAEKEQQERRDLENAIKELAAVAKQAELQIALLKKEEAAALAELQNLRVGPVLTPKVQRLRDEVEHQAKVVAGVYEDITRLNRRLNEQSKVGDAGRSRRFAEAYLPTEKEYGRPIKFAVAGGAVVFALILGGMCLLEARKGRVSASDELMESLGMPVVGVLPKMPLASCQKTARNIAAIDSRYGMTEAVDAIRTVLLHAPRVDGARVVMVTSATGGEGKSTLASHLAASLARAWRKTLLIDGDLRNPAQHIQFEQPAEPGLCEALRGEVEFEDIIKPTMISRLWMVPAGKIDAHALQSLSQEGVTSVFDALKEMYDFIVIDTSPVLPVPEALLFGKQADAVLLSVMKDISRLPAVYQAHQRLDSLGIRILGAVVIGEKTETYGRSVTYPAEA